MKTLTVKETNEVTGGIWLQVLVYFYEEVFSAAIKDALNNDLEHLGELENRPVGTRP